MNLSWFMCYEKFAYSKVCQKKARQLPQIINTETPKLRNIKNRKI